MTCLFRRRTEWNLINGILFILVHLFLPLLFMLLELIAAENNLSIFKPLCGTHYYVL